MWELRQSPFLCATLWRCLPDVWPTFAPWLTRWGLPHDAFMVLTRGYADANIASADDLTAFCAGPFAPIEATHWDTRLSGRARGGDQRQRPPRR